MSNLIPEGRYKAIVHDFGTGASNTKCTSYLRLGLRILEGDCAGRIIDAMLWITDKTRPRVATDLVAIGYDSDEDPLAAFGNAKTLEQVPCAARPVQIVVKHEEFNGRVDARVAYINALSKEVPPATAESRAAWKDAFSKARQGQGRERAPAPQPIEDTPFLPLSPSPPAPEACAVARASGAWGVGGTRDEPLCKDHRADRRRHEHQFLQLPEGRLLLASRLQKPGPHPF